MRLFFIVMLIFIPVFFLNMDSARAQADSACVIDKKGTLDANTNLCMFPLRDGEAVACRQIGGTVQGNNCIANEDLLTPEAINLFNQVSGYNTWCEQNFSFNSEDECVVQNVSSNECSSGGGQYQANTCIVGIDSFTAFIPNAGSARCRSAGGTPNQSTCVLTITDSELRDLCSTSLGGTLSQNNGCYFGYDELIVDNITLTELLWFTGSNTDADELLCSGDFGGIYDEVSDDCIFEIDQSAEDKCTVDANGSILRAGDPNCNSYCCSSDVDNLRQLNPVNISYFEDNDDDSEDDSNGEDDIDRGDVASYQGEEACQLEDGANVNACIRCIRDNGVYTAIGCIDTTPIGLIQVLIRIAYGVMGGVALVLLIATGLAYQSGNEERIRQAREQFLAVIAGVALLTFSVLILSIIGVNIFDVVPLGQFIDPGS